MLGLSLCSGAGGLDLGLHIAEPGYRTVGHVERDAFAAAVLVARMEEAALAPAPVWDELGTFDGRPWRGAVDILLLRWTADEVFALHRRHGIEPNPLYRAGMHRVGCMPCVNCRKDELRQIARRFPEQVERIAEWEALVAQASKRGAATFFPSPTANGRGRVRGGPVQRHVAWAMTSHGGRQLDMLRLCEDATACASAYGLCE